MKFILVFFLGFYIFKQCHSSELINDFNFSASIDGLYKLDDGRTFESSSLKGHIKNNIGNYGNIKCNSLIEKKMMS